MGQRLLAQHLFAKTQKMVAIALATGIVCYIEERPFVLAIYVQNQRPLNIFSLIKKLRLKPELSLGDQGSQIKSSMIQIPSHPYLIMDYDTNPIPR